MSSMSLSYFSFYLEEAVDSLLVTIGVSIASGVGCLPLELKFHRFYYVGHLNTLINLN